MNILELEFCERYEAKVMELQLLTILKDDLTQKGKEALQSIQRWIDFNTEKYLTITGQK